MERLDYFLVSGSMTSNIVLTDIDPKFASDHAIRHFSFNIGTQDNGPSYWKLNTSLLEYQEYQIGTEEIIERQVTENADTKLRWEMLKMNVRGYSFQTGTRKKKAEKNKLEALMHKQYQLTLAIDTNSDDFFLDNERQLALISAHIEEIM